jgi:predicted RNase H-like HicB family nuclease
MSSRTLTAVVQKEGGDWVSWCPELDIASQGQTVEQAKANLQEAVDLFLETASRQEIERLLRTETYVSSLEVTIG